VAGYVSLIEIRLHQNGSRSLKEKRKLVRSLKDQVRRRFGASVAEIDGHDTWQRAGLLCSLVGDAAVGDRGAELARFAESRCPEGCSTRIDLRSLSDLRD
jgi:uncharacterized protein